MTCATPSVDTLGGYLRTARKGRGLTLAEVGKRAGIHMVHICDIELNKRRASEALLARLAEVLEVPLSEIERRDARFAHKHSMEALRRELAAERQKSAELAASLVDYQRALVVTQQERDELKEHADTVEGEAQRLRHEAVALRDSSREVSAERDRIAQELDEARGEILGLQRMLDEARGKRSGNCRECGMHPDSTHNCLNSWCSYPKKARGA